MRYLYRILFTMNLRQHLITLIEAYAQAKGLSLSRVSTLLFSSGTKYEQLVSGADLNVGRLEDAIKKIAGDWPEGHDWPEGIARPALAQPNQEVVS
jgi:hypothetical protein